jgi:iron complex outermembrane receptor protein
VVGDYGTYNTWSSGAILTGRSGGFFFAGAARKRATDGYASSLTVKKATASAAKPTTGTQVNGWNSTTDSQGNAAYLVGDAGLNWYRDESYYGKLGYDFSKKTSLSVDYTHTFYRYGYDTGNSYLTDVSGKSVTTGSVYYYDPSTAKWESFSVTPYLFMGTYGGNTINRVAASGESRIEDLSIKGGFTWDKNDYWWVQPSATSPYVQPSWTRNIRGEVALSHPLPLGQALMLGAEVGGITSHNETDSLNGWGSQDNRTGVTTALQRGKTLLTGVYLQDKIKLLKSLDVYLGARWDDWSVSDGYNYSVKTGPTTLAQTFGTSEESRVSPRASAVYAIDGETRLKGSIGGAFRGPSPSDMFSSWQSVSSGVTTTSLANDGLKPEKVFSGEVGVEKYVSKKTSLQVTYFHNHMTDYIYTKSFTAAEVAAFNSAKGTNFSTITQKQNIASASCDGLELGMRNRVAGWLEAFGNCTAMQSKVASNPSNSSSVGKQLPSIPGVTFNVGMDAFWKGLGANVTGRYVGKAYSKDDNSDIYNNVFGSYDPFFVVDAKVSYGVSVGRFQPKVSVACNNIGNLQYYQYYKSPGRTWTLSAEAAF